MKTIDEIINEVSEMHPYKEAGNRDSYSEYNEGWSDACEELGSRINDRKPRINSFDILIAVYVVIFILMSLILADVFIEFITGKYIFPFIWD